MARSGQEVVCEGWLTKSPPTKRIWRARWRRRWFSLRHSGEIPNQFILTYYADKHCRKLKGYINLDDCEQVDLGLKLDERKLKFDHVFDIKTPTRTYYLAADTESEMKSWVDCICQVCGLKSTSDEEDLHISKSEDIDIDIVYCEEMRMDDKRIVAPSSNNETPPVSPVSTNPYIPISECITGKTPILTPEDLKALFQQNMKNAFFKSDITHMNQTYGIPQRIYLNYVNDMQDPRFYDSPRVLSPDTNNKKNTSPLQSPTDTDSVFTDDDMADVNVVVKEKFTKSKPRDDSNSDFIAPPRPPKSATMAPSTYINLGKIENSIEKEKKVAGGVTTDEMYDFPRSHQIADADLLQNKLLRRHVYNNAAPVKVDGQIFRYDISPKPSTSTNQVFRYDTDDVTDEPASPLSQSSSTTAYSNLPSPLLADSQLMPPPIVNRDLKPKRKLSDSLSSCSNPEPSSPRSAPSVDRKLKPPTPLQEAHNRKAKQNALGDDFKNDRIRAAPGQPLGRSHESLLMHSNHEEQIYHYLPAKMKYLYLDLNESPSSLSTSTSTITKSLGDNTVYKKVDFEKTEAFNLTRNNLEKERMEPNSFPKK